jgi:hypothetical protein
MCYPCSRTPVTLDSGLYKGRGEGEEAVALAYVQQSWVKDFVTNPSAVEATDEDELVVTL